MTKIRLTIDIDAPPFERAFMSQVATVLKREADQTRHQFHGATVESFDDRVVFIGDVAVGRWEVVHDWVTAEEGASQSEADESKTSREQH